MNVHTPSTGTGRTGRRRSERQAALAVVGVLAASTVALTLPPGASGSPRAAGEELEVPLYTVVQEGLTPTEGAQLAETAGIGNALRPDGSFGYVDARSFATVPTVEGERGVDEDKNETVAAAVDLETLDRLQVPADEEALRRAGDLMPVPLGYHASTSVDHTTFDQVDEKGQLLRSVPLDTTVSYQLYLDRTPVVGPGARLRVGFGSNGSVVQLTHAVRRVEQGKNVRILDPETAREGCARLYPGRVRQGTPVLGYYAPPLAAREASGTPAVRALAPHYVCQPVQRDSQDTSLGGRLLPAAPDLVPSASLKVTGTGKKVTVSVKASGGTGKYSYRWSSSTTRLSTKRTGRAFTFTRNSRSAKRAEAVTVTVTDLNGVSATASVSLKAGRGRASARAVPGGAGGDLATVGIEQTVDEWSCAQDSADGFRSVMADEGHTVSFDWRGYSAWEKDFKKTSLSGIDTTYVDAVDAQWYTGHGSANSFTFKSSVSDTSIVPGDAEWGDDFDLEWMQLESCQVLRDVTGTNDYFARWAPVFDGLHLLNGFDTNAACVSGGTGERFAEYLFPEKFLWWTVRDPLTVQQAWGAMAGDLEPAGRRWRSISPAAAGWVTNLGDHFWGQGSVGPDIPASARIGWVAISGVA